MSWTDIDTWIVVTGVLISMACAIPGVFLLLNKQSMLGDAISHAVLPGLAIAFLLSGSREPQTMVVGAVCAGLLTAVLSGSIQRSGNVESGASLGVVFCSLFALGLILIRLAADHVDLDPGCVLYGAIELAVVDVGPVPRVAWLSAGILLFNLLLAMIFHKELRLAAFDPRFASTAGIPPQLMRHGLTVVTAITSVIAFESVGSILVVAMLIVPGATALLVCRRVTGALIISLLVAAISATGGHLAAITIAPTLLGMLTNNPQMAALSSAGMMAAVSGILFFLVLLATNLRAALAVPTDKV
jgi:manganese/zinc/iron transport system permease protein